MGGAGVRTRAGLCVRLLRSPDKPMSATSPQGGHKCIMALRSTWSWQAQGGWWYMVDINWDKVMNSINNLRLLSQKNLHCHNDALRSPTLRMSSHVFCYYIYLNYYKRFKQDFRDKAGPDVQCKGGNVKTIEVFNLALKDSQGLVNWCQIIPAE